MEMQHVLAAKERARDAVMAIAGVVGIGVTEKDDQPAVLILVSKKDQQLDDLLPREIEGFQVVVEEVGKIVGA